jgi:uncharacterized membrane protein
MAESNDNDVKCEAERLAYVVDLYTREFDRRDRLEKKSQFQLSFATLLMGVFALKPEVLKLIGESKALGTWAGQLMLYSSLVGLAAAVLGALLTTLLAVRVQEFRKEYPANAMSKLLDPAKVDWPAGDRASMLRSFTANYLVALESSAEVLRNKAKWVRISWYFVVASAAFFTIFLTVMFIIPFERGRG